MQLYLISVFWTETEIIGSLYVLGTQMFCLFIYERSEARSITTVQVDFWPSGILIAKSVIARLEPYRLIDHYCNFVLPRKL